MAHFAPNRASGKLIVFEGISASGKSTHLRLLARWLESERYTVVVSECAPVQECVLANAAELAHRIESRIAPMLKAGAVVLTDVYAPQRIAEAVVRGYPRTWARNLYRFAIAPDLGIALRLQVSAALVRKRLQPGADIAADAALALGLSPNAEESFRLFQARLAEEHQKILAGVSMQWIDASGPVPGIQRRIRSLVQRQLAGARTLLRPPAEKERAIAAGSKVS